METVINSVPLAELFVTNVRRYLAIKHWKIADLCRVTGIKGPQMYDYLNGVSSPSLAVVGRIAEGLGVSAWRLFEDGKVEEPLCVDHGVKECARRVCELMEKEFGLVD